MFYGMANIFGVHLLFRDIFVLKSFQTVLDTIFNDDRLSSILQFAHYIIIYASTIFTKLLTIFLWYCKIY